MKKMKNNNEGEMVQKESSVQFKEKWSKLSKFTKISNIVLLVLLFLSFVAAVLSAIFIPSNSNEATTRSQFVLMALQSFLSIIILFLPFLISKKFDLYIPIYLKLILVLFIYAAVFLGEVQSYYYKFEYWDAFLHTLSGGIFAVLAFSVISLMNDSEIVNLNLSPLFIAFFAFCFSVTVGAVWEIYEFTVDCLLGTDMQKYMASIEGVIFTDGKTPLDGTDEAIAEFFRSPAGYKFALMDTMQDLIVDAIGAIVMSVVSYFILVQDKKTMVKMSIRKNSALQKEAMQESLQEESNQQGEQVLEQDVNKESEQEND